MRLPFSRTLQLTIEEKNLRKKLKKENYTFSDYRFNMIRNETKDWKLHYLPISIDGKTVLDFGAGEGETARFFELNGAKMIIAIEPCNDCFAYLIANSLYHQIQAIRDNFSFEIMQRLTEIYNPSLIKIDIEGFEEELLFNDMLPVPTVIELHGLQQIRKFERNGWVVKKPKNNFGCTSYAYWGIKFDN